MKKYLLLLLLFPAAIFAQEKISKKITPTQDGLGMKMTITIHTDSSWKDSVQVPEPLKGYQPVKRRLQTNTSWDETFIRGKNVSEAQARQYLEYWDPQPGKGEKSDGQPLRLEPERIGDSVILKTLYTTREYGKYIINSEVKVKYITPLYDLKIKNPFTYSYYPLVFFISLGVISTIGIVAMWKHQTLSRKMIK